MCSRAKQAQKTKTRDLNMKLQKQPELISTSAALGGSTNKLFMLTTGEISTKKKSPSEFY